MTLQPTPLLFLSFVLGVAALALAVAHAIHPSRALSRAVVGLLAGLLAAGTLGTALAYQALATDSRPAEVLVREELERSEEREVREPMKASVVIGVIVILPWLIGEGRRRRAPGAGPAAEHRR